MHVSLNKFDNIKTFEGLFQWDPMITTPPGLYLISVGIIKPIAALRETKMLTACSTFWLRSINILFAIGNFYLIYALLKKLQDPILVGTAMGLDKQNFWM